MKPTFINNNETHDIEPSHFDNHLKEIERYIFKEEFDYMCDATFIYTDSQIKTGFSTFQRTGDILVCSSLYLMAYRYDAGSFIRFKQDKALEHTIDYIVDLKNKMKSIQHVVNFSKETMDALPLLQNLLTGLVNDQSADLSILDSQRVEPEKVINGSISQLINPTVHTNDIVYSWISSNTKFATNFRDNTREYTYREELQEFQNKAVATEFNFMKTHDGTSENKILATIYNEVTGNLDIDYPILKSDIYLMKYLTYLELGKIIMEHENNHPELIDLSTVYLKDDVYYYKQELVGEFILPSELVENYIKDYR